MSMTTASMKGEIDMAYETKVLLIAISRIVREIKDPRKIHEALEEMANAEGVILKPYEDEAE